MKRVGLSEKAQSNGYADRQWSGSFLSFRCRTRALPDDARVRELATQRSGLEEVSPDHSRETA
jgi:hypothetical protein